MARRKLEDMLTHKEFQALWQFSVKMKAENLITEILACKHLRLLDPFSAFVMIGDVGTRIYLYYFGCEEQLQIRRIARQ